MIKKSVWVCLIGIGIPLAFFSSAFSENEGRDQLIFSHQFHIEEVEAACLVCHSAAEQSTLASDRLFPPMEACGQCHEVEDTSECGMCHTNPKQPKALPSPVRTIYFPHQRHLATGKTECLDCHAGVEHSEALKRSYIPPMKVCARCHEGDLTASGCSQCHTKVEDLRPASHDEDWSRGHRWFVQAGDATCTMCHRDSYCGECHDAGALVRPKEALSNPHASFASRLGEGPNMVLEGVHDLNYRYTHALDLKGKGRNCSTCHETSFCVTCHRSDEKTDRFKPAWHGGEDWGAWAGEVGTGGGRHAEQARRDIEQCAACHDTQGNDPICLLCHMDRTPGRGNDPRTHEVGFANDMGYGPWHEDEGAVCYTCHLDREGPEGFCQYCHGGK